MRQLQIERERGFQVRKGLDHERNAVVKLRLEQKLLQEKIVEYRERIIMLQDDVQDCERALAAQPESRRASKDLEKANKRMMVCESRIAQAQCV